MISYKQIPILVFDSIKLNGKKMVIRCVIVILLRLYIMALLKLCIKIDISFVRVGINFDDGTKCPLGYFYLGTTFFVYNIAIAQLNYPAISNHYILLKLIMI